MLDLREKVVTKARLSDRMFGGGAGRKGRAEAHAEARRLDKLVGGTTRTVRVLTYYTWNKFSGERFTWYLVRVTGGN